MSYILDALKKSEAERSRGNGVSLLNYSDHKQVAGIPIWLIIFLTLTLNLVAILLWTQWPINFSENAISDTAAQIKAPSPNDKADVARPIVNSSLPPTDMPKSAPKPTAATKRQVTTPVLSQLVNSGNSQVVRPFSQLSESQKQAFPELEFSTHVYTEDPKLRALIANGTQLREGELVTKTLRLIEITEVGAIFFYDGQKIEIPVLQEWRLQ